MMRFWPFLLLPKPNCYLAWQSVGTLLPWTASIAPICADLRAHCEGAGITLGAMDMLIAAHAKAAEAVLVSADGDFSENPHRLCARKLALALKLQRL